jgi:hypothetical protein
VPKLSRNRFWRVDTAFTRPVECLVGGLAPKYARFSVSAFCCTMTAVMRMGAPQRPLTLARIARVWWPRAAELSAASAFVARLPNPRSSGRPRRSGLSVGAGHRVTHHHAVGGINRTLQGSDILPQVLGFHDACGCGFDGIASAGGFYLSLRSGPARATVWARDAETRLAVQLRGRRRPAKS